MKNDKLFQQFPYKSYRKITYQLKLKNIYKTNNGFIMKVF